ncbi:MFS phospholipid transporter Git1 [Aureobasidium sp. EXF-8845]|nr:MFS phospholipid transporter Git1 [Aureobasidium sp. EXF-8845]KAI4856887.1 MFS phospholipid transporter Git1 [Aureobasidium sp. EXF-8846]
MWSDNCSCRFEETRLSRYAAYAVIMAIKDVFRQGALQPSFEKSDVAERVQETPVEVSTKTWWQRRAPVIACGSGLFSDGYLNGVIGSVNTILRKLYKQEYKHSNAQSNITSLVFAGEVVGIIIFGYTSDRFSRKWSIFASTVILFVFAALAAGSYGAHGSINSMLSALAAYRFLLGIGIGGEYPAGSVGCSESTGELESGTRSRWFIWFTNLAIDAGFVVAAFVPMVVVLATGDDHLRAAWRIMLGIGVIPPLSLFYMRYKLQEPEAYKRNTMAKCKTPWMLILKKYWFRLLIVSTIWFIYDYSSYAFGTYSAPSVDNVLGADAPMWKTFGWNTVINLFYIPGAFIGSYVSDWIGPRKALAYGVTAQAVVGLIMAGCYEKLAIPKNIGGFCVVYGIFLSLGELGPGDNIGLIASKTSPTAIRGRYYAVAAAFGKIGAFIGNYLYPILVADAGSNTIKGNQYPFWVASSLCILSAFLAFFCLPEIGQDTIDHEDATFKNYLIEHGWDISRIGLAGTNASKESDAESSQHNVSKTDDAREH